MKVRASAVVHQDTPAAAVVTAAATVEPAQDNDSLEVQVDVNSVQTSPVGTLQQQQLVPEAYMEEPWECTYRKVEWREGPRRYGIPCLPTYLVPKQEVEEVPLYELSPIGRKFYTPIRTQCCSGAGFHLYRQKWCVCRSRICFSD